MGTEKQSNVQELDLHQLLAKVLQSNAEAAGVQRQILQLELDKKGAIDRKEAEAAARIERDREQLHEQMKLRIVNEENRIRNCSHTDQKGSSTIYPISNHPDRQLRGICTKCPIYIQPAHYETDARGNKTLIPEHPLYRTVLQRDQALYSEFVPTTAY